MALLLLVCSVVFILLKLFLLRTLDDDGGDGGGGDDGRITVEKRDGGGGGGGNRHGTEGTNANAFAVSTLESRSEGGGSTTVAVDGGHGDAAETIAAVVLGLWFVVKEQQQTKQ